jgi:hypothetical protein
MQNTIDKSYDRMDTIEIELNEVRGNQADFVSPEDIENLKEQVQVKVDR